jgi:hypothetical protein
LRIEACPRIFDQLLFATRRRTSPATIRETAIAT